jgi:hypothetical protein
MRPIESELLELRAIATEMRKLGVVQYKCNSLEILLGPEPPGAPREDETPDQRALRERKEQLEVLLHSSGADASPFLEMENP